MLTLDEAKKIVSKYEDNLPASMETFRRWVRQGLVSGSVKTEYYGGIHGKDVYYRKIIIYEIVTALRLKRSGWKLQEIADSRKILKELGLLNSYPTSNFKIEKMLQNHKVIPAVKSKIEDKRKEIQQKINNNAELSEMQQEFKKLEKLEQTALLSKEYLQKYIEVMEEVDNFKLPNASF
jgi:hypothetical protein